MNTPDDFPKCAPDWRGMYETERGKRISLETGLARAQERIRELEKNDARWRKAREIFSIEDIERADREMRETGSTATEEENVKADTAIDRAMEAK